MLTVFTPLVPLDLWGMQSTVNGSSETATERPDRRDSFQSIMVDTYRKQKEVV